jgi:crotonobetainyl-CoA:carnitine CoA-transferase CaiB-like acyl-CoA transferase
MAKPLDGITVIEFAGNLGSAYAAMLMAEYGARTIRIEPPQGDPARGTPHFHVLNRSKHALFLDLDSSVDLGKAHDLLKIADVVVSGFVPARERALGIDHASLRRLSPSAILLQMPPLGSRGPYADFAAHDDLVRAWSGIFATQSSRSGNPVVTVFPAPSYEAGLLGAAAAVAGLIARHNGAASEPAEVSLLAGSLALQSGDFVRHPKLVTTQPGPADPLGPYPVIRLFKGSDGLYLIVDCTSVRFCQRLAGAIGQPQLFEDPRFKEAPWRVPRDLVPELKNILDRAFLQRPRDEWIRILRQYEVPAAPVLTRDQFMEDPQVRHLGMRRQVDDPKLGPTIQMGPPIYLHGTPGEIAGPAPAIAPENPLLDGLLKEARGRNGSMASVNSQSAGSGAGPLAGIRVIDFSSYIAGSFGPMLLAHLGAEVIKVEGPDGDSLRYVAGFRAWNQNKLGLGLDLKSPQGLEIVYDLVRQADVFVENFRPGRTRALGIDYERLSAINPRLIYMTVTGFGSSGPDYDRPGLDPLAQAVSGTMEAHSGSGYSGADSPKHPLYMTLPIADYGAATLSALGCILALRARQITGKGQHCETSLIHAVMALQAGEFVFYDGRPNLENGAPESRGPAALRRVYQCQDGKWIYLAISSEQSWQALRSRIAQLPATSFEQAREAGPDGDLARLISDYCARFASDQLFEALMAADIPVARVRHMAHMFEEAQVAANEFLTALQDPELGTVEQGAPFIKFNGARARVTPAPLLGQHTSQVLARFLGYDADRIARLREAKVIFGG